MFKALIKIVIVLGIGLGGYYLYQFYNEEPVPTVDVEEVSFEDVQRGDVVTTPPEEDEEESVDVVDEPEDTADEEPKGIAEGEPVGQSINLAVPFTPQAPHANWDLPYQEACEEASALMVVEYYKGTSGLIDPDRADQELLDVIAFEDDFFGYHLDTTAQETATFMDMYYGISATVKENPTIEDIENELRAGRPVILPAAGKQLGNPFFSGEGPLYHMLVIKGFTDTQFITNDPGTRNGNNFAYSKEVIMEAMGDWNDGDPANGAKRVIFTAP